MSKRLPSQDEIKAILRYEPETGVFYWVANTYRQNRIGKVAGTNKSDGRRHINIKDKPYLSYRLAWVYMTGSEPKGVIDHIDGDPSNDRWSNLRDVSHRANSQNQRGPMRDNKCGLLGVTRHRKKFAAHIKFGGIDRHIGVFDTPEQAHDAYLSAKREYHEGCTI